MKGIRTRALKKRRSASFLAYDRSLLQSIKVCHAVCFAKDKSESLSLCSETGILHDAMHRATCGVNPCVARTTASEERSKRLHLRKSSEADIANDCTNFSCKMRSIVACNKSLSVDRSLVESLF